VVKRFFSEGKNLLTKKQEGILSAAVVMMIIILITKAVGFLRQFLFAHYFGASRELDMFIAANTIPEMIVNLLILGSVNAALIPVVFESIEEKGETKTRGLIRTIFTVFGSALIVFSFVAFLFAGQMIQWSVDIANPEVDFTEDQLSQMVSMLRILLISPAVLGISNLITGVLHVYQRFIIPQLAPLLYNIGGLVAIFILVPYMGVSGLAVGVVFGSFLHIFIQLPLLRHLNISFRPKFNFRDPYLHKIGRLMLPRVMGLAASQVSLLVDRILALGLMAGSASAFVFAESIKIIPVSIFGLSISSAAFPVLSKEAAAGKLMAFKSTLARSLNQIIFLAVPVTAVLLVLRVPAVRLVLGLGSGNFTWEDTLTTAWVLLFFSIGLIAESLTSLVVKAFYALHDTKTPVMVSVITIIISVITSIALTNYFSHFENFDLDQFFQDSQTTIHWLTERNGEQAPSVGGLALSASISVTFEIIALVVLLSRKLGNITKNDLLIPVLKKLTMGIIMAGVMYFIYSIWNTILNTTRTVNILILTTSTSLAGFSIYTILAYIFSCEEVVMLEKAFVIFVNVLENWRKYLSKLFGKKVYIDEIS